MYRARKWLAAVFVFTGPSFLCAQNQDTNPAPVSNVVNSERPGWMHFSASERVRMEYITGEGFEPINDRYLLNLLQLNMTL